MVAMHVTKPTTSGVGTGDVSPSPLYATRITTVVTEATKRFAEHYLADGAKRRSIDAPLMIVFLLIMCVMARQTALISLTKLDAIKVRNPPSWCVKRTDKSTLSTVLPVPLMHYDLSDVGS